MDEPSKKSILQREQNVLKQKIASMKKRISFYNEKIEEIHKEAPEIMEHADEVADTGSTKVAALLAKRALYKENAENLEELTDSPYFAKCVFLTSKNDEPQIIYIGKHLDRRQEIFSWVSPIARLRFEPIGDASYMVPGGNVKYATLLEKLNYIITNSDIVYLTQEIQRNEKELIYHKHLSERKQFALPEIIAQMEEAQDTIIRSDPKGGFLISGPAGSGKTTLALHRIAYLIQSPEFQELFQSEDMIVFVSDETAIAYFSKLLVELGIKLARITTFLQWGTDIINIHYNLRNKPLTKKSALSIIETEMEEKSILKSRIVLDEIKKWKLKALEKADLTSLTPEYIFTLYKKFEVDKQFRLIFHEFIDNQVNDHWLDDIDCAALINNDAVYKKTYNHVVVDEVQNWLPMQLDIVLKIVDEELRSVTYVGDINQRTRAFSIRSWDELKTGYPIDHSVTLTKVYRNTKQILKWLKTKGYDVADDKVIKDGPEVNVQMCKYENEQNDRVMAEINKMIEEDYKGQIGVLSKYDEDLDFAEDQLWSENVHFLSVEDAQGMEFDTVFLINAQHFADDTDYFSLNDPKMVEESRKVDRQLFFVAATRAQEALKVYSVQ